MEDVKRLVELDQELVKGNPITHIRKNIFKLNQSQFGAIVGCSMSYISKVECLGVQELGSKLESGLETLGYNSKQVNDLYIEHLENKRKELMERIA